MSTPSGANVWTLPPLTKAVWHRTPIVVHEWKNDPDDAPGKSTFVRDLRVKTLINYTVVFGLLYAICLFVPYGMTDAYTKLYQSIHGTLWSDDVVAIEGGRPLLALFTDLSLRSLHSYEDLRYLVAVSILGIILLAWTFHQALRLAGIGKYPAAIIPVLICVTPAFQVYAAWAVCAYYPYAAVLAGIALVTVEQGYQSTSLKPKLALSGVGFVVFLCSLLIYQPAAMMYWVFAAIFLLSGRAGFKATIVRFVHYSIVAGGGLASAFVAMKLAPIAVGQSVATRSALVTDYMGKSQWFLHDVMTNALNLYNVTPKRSIAIEVAAGIALGLFAFVAGSLSARAAKLVIALTLVPLCYLPNLVISDNWPSYRTQVALTSIVVLYVALGLLSLRKAHIPMLTLVAYGGLLVIAVVGGYSAARNVALDFAVPQYEELALMRTQLSSPKLDTATSVYLIPATWEDAFAPVVRYDEYGVVSSSVAWSEKPMVYFVLRDINPSHDEIPVTVAPATGPFNPPPGSLVVDMRSVKTLAPFPPNFG